MKKFFVVSILIFFALLNFSCKKKIPQESVPTVEEILHEENSVVAIVFGSGYNEDEFVNATLEAIKEKHKIESVGDVLFPIIYPKDFKYDGITRVSMLPSIVAQKTLRALLIVGAPENMHYSLAKLQEQFATGDLSEFPIISFFSQDDVLGTEAGADIVFDFYNFDVSSEETDLIFLNEIPSIVAESVASILSFDKKNQTLESLEEAAAKFVGSEWKVVPYTDPDTGLRAANHFLLEKIPPEIFAQELDQKHTKNFGKKEKENAPKK